MYVPFFLCFCLPSLYFFLFTPFFSFSLTFFLLYFFEFLSLLSVTFIPSFIWIVVLFFNQFCIYFFIDKSEFTMRLSRVIHSRHCYTKNATWRRKKFCTTSLLFVFSFPFYLFIYVSKCEYIWYIPNDSISSVWDIIKYIIKYIMNWEWSGKNGVVVRHEDGAW